MARASARRSSLLPLVERLTRAGATALVTTGTVTSAATAGAAPAGGRDASIRAARQPAFMRRFFQHWRPDAALIAESELWPNMIVEAKRAGVPLAMVNARMSERSFRRWGTAPRFIGALLGGFDLCLARSEERRRAARRRSARRSVLVVGNIKYDAPAPPADRRELAALAGLTSGRQIWIAASTHEGEEGIAAPGAHGASPRSFPTR